MATTETQGTGNIGKCGWFSCTPGFLQRFASVNVFIGVLFTYNFVHGFQGSYTISILTTLEKRFDLPSYMSGMLVTASTIGYIATILLVSHFCKHSHMPKVFLLSSLLAGTCAVLYTMPHFLYGTGNDDIDLHDLEVNISSGISKQEVPSQYCSGLHTTSENTSWLLQEHCKERTEAGDVVSGPILAAYAIFLLSEIVHGIAGTPIWTVGLAFVDNKTSRTASSRLIGLMMSVRYLAPLTAFALGAFFVSMYGNLQPTSLTPSHPKWIGAWWLGFVVCVIFNLLCACALSLMPRDLRESTSNHKVSSSPESNGFLTEKEDKARDDEDSEDIMMPMAEIKDLPKAIVRLLSNSVFVLTIIAISIDALFYGYMMFIPKYLEVQFQQTAARANILGGLGPALCGGTASFVSGYLASKLKDGKVSTYAMLCTVFSVACSIFLILMVTCGCDQIQIYGETAENGAKMTEVCTANCTCNSHLYDPVCGDGNLYFSPCHAGCPLPLNNTNDLAQCQCVESGQATKGLCETDCPSILPYLVTMFLGLIAWNLYNIPITKLLLGCVDKEDKALSMGLMTFVVCIMVFPAPLLFGHIYDSSCILPMPGDPCSDMTEAQNTGACLLYDRESLRIKLHLVVAIIKLTATLLFFLAWLLAQQKDKKKQKDLAKARDMLRESVTFERLDSVGKRLALKDPENRYSYMYTTS